MAAISLCKIEGCGKPVKTRGWCVNHYGRWLRNGSPTKGVRLTPGHGVCSIEGCGAEGKLIRGWCSKHYQRWQSNGDPLVSKIDREGPKTCTVAGCGGATWAKGLCQSHYAKERGRMNYECTAVRRHSEHGAINVLSVEDSAYIAGMIDADGMVTVTNAGGGRIPAPMVCVTNGDFALIEWLQATIGAGYAYRTKTRPRRPDQNRDNWNPVHRYQVTGWKAISLLKYVSPFMRVKVKQARLIEALSIRGRDFPRSATKEQVAAGAIILAEVRRLNRRGIKQAA